MSLLAKIIAELRERPQCAFVRQALDRAERDLKRKDIVFDEEAATRAIKFFPLFRHYKGEYAGKPFRLLAWQQFVVAQVFGWRRKDGTRRFRRVYVEVPRKNGKTTLASGVANYLAIADREEGAEVYCVATKEDQAKIAWRDCVQFLRGNERFAAAMKFRVKHVEFPKRNAILKPLGADSQTLDGLNPHAAIFDELHAWKSRDLWDVIEDGMGFRRQPLIFAITTAGFNREGFCFELRAHALNVLAGRAKDDELLALVYTIDDDDDPFDERVWRKANPSLGESKSEAFMRSQAHGAQQIPSKLYAFLNKQLDVWTTAEKAWLSADAWNSLRVPRATEESLRGKRCYCGLDLSRTGDLTAFAMLFPPQDGVEKATALVDLWLPSKNMRERERADGAPYQQWVRDGFLSVCAHGYINRDFVAERIKARASQFQIAQIAYDRWGSREIAEELSSHNLEILNFGQGFKDMSPATKSFEELVVGGELAHIENPALDWCVANVAVEQDAAGNIKLSKRKSFGRIDGAVALAMAIGAWRRQPERKHSWLDELREREKKKTESQA